MKKRLHQNFNFSNPPTLRFPSILIKFTLLILAFFCKIRDCNLFIHSFYVFILCLKCGNKISQIFWFIFNFFHFVTKYFIVTLFEGTLTCCQALGKKKVFSELFSMVFDRSILRINCYGQRAPYSLWLGGGGPFLSLFFKRPGLSSG